MNKMNYNLWMLLRIFNIYEISDEPKEQATACISTLFFLSFSFSFGLGMTTIIVVISLSVWLDLFMEYFSNCQIQLKVFTAPNQRIHNASEAKKNFSIDYHSTSCDDNYWIANFHIKFEVFFFLSTYFILKFPNI